MPISPGDYKLVRDEWTKGWFIITDKAVDSLRREEMPEAVLSKLKSQKDNVFESREKLSKSLERVLTKEELEALAGTGTEA